MSDFKQCDAFRPDGERCKRAALTGSDYCHSHRAYRTPMVTSVEPLPEGMIAPISASAWGFCEFCHDAYPLADLRPDANKNLACRSCYLRSDVLESTTPPKSDKSPKRYIAAFQLEELAAHRGLTFEAAVTEILDNGFRPEKHCGYLFYVKEVTA